MSECTDSATLQPQKKRLALSLSAHNVRPCLSADLPRCARGELERTSGFENYFSFWRIWAVGGKPERQIFEYLLDRYELSAAETVFVDDHPPNIDAARELGLHAIWFRNARQCATELEALIGRRMTSLEALTRPRLVPTSI